MTKTFVRQKTIHCGRDRKQVKIFNYSDEREQAVKQTGRVRKNVTPPKQRDLNDRHAKEYFGQLVLTNFVENDYLLHATYAPENLPQSMEDARKSFHNFMERIKHRCKKKGLPPPKFINVTERGEKSGRVHHHCFLKTELARDEVENLWRLPKKKGEKEGAQIGYINADRLQGELDPVIGYVAKSFDGSEDEQAYAPLEWEQGELEIDEREARPGRPKNQRRWTQSQNLVMPWVTDNKSAWSKRELESAAREHADDREYWERRFPGWTLVNGTTAKARYSEETGWSLDIKLRKKDVSKTKTHTRSFPKGAGAENAKTNERGT